MKRILSVLLCAILLVAFVAGIFALWSLRYGKSNSDDPASAGQPDTKGAAGNAASAPADAASASGKKDEKEPDNAPIVTVSLYKNGFCFVTREIPVRDWSEPLTLTRSIAPRHGTLWFVPAETTLRRTSRERTVTQDPAPAPKKNDAPGYRPDWSSMTDVFEWQEVTIRLKEGGTVSGRVVGNQKPLPPEPPKENDPSELLIMDELSSYRAASSSSRNLSSSSYSPSVPVKSSFGAAFLTLQTEDGRFVSVRQSDVVEIDAKSLYEGPAPVTPAPRTTKVVEDVQIVEAPKDHSGPVSIHYLTEGITWSPFYNLILSDKPGTVPDADGVLTINAAATVMNNYSDFENAEVELISGFPSLDFASVVGAVAKKLPLTTFLSSLANPKNGTPNYLQNSGVMGQGGVMSQSVLSNSARPVREIFKEDDLDEMPSAPSKWSASAGLEDIQYKSVGKLSMKKGDAVYLPIATKETPFEYVTTWSAPMAEPYSYGFKTSDTNVWSTVRFKNPFDFALTTAPYEIFRDGKVLGQSTGAWFGAGETASVKITRAMAVSCSMSYSETGNRDRVFTVRRPNMSDLNYRHPDVTAELTLTNISDKPVKMVVDSVFYGELLTAEENPTKVRQMSERSLNNKYKLVWTLTLPANTKKTISYTYSTVKEQ